jgi:hypothetical protein
MSWSATSACSQTCACAGGCEKRSPWMMYREAVRQRCTTRHDAELTCGSCHKRLQSDVRLRGRL